MPANIDAFGNEATPDMFPGQQMVYGYQQSADSSDESIGSVFSDLYEDIASGKATGAFGMAAPFFAPVGLVAAGAAGFGAAGAAGAAEGAGALGAAGAAEGVGGTALGFGGEAAADASLGSWFSGLGEAGLEGGMVGGEAAPIGLDYASMGMEVPAGAGAGQDLITGASGIGGEAAAGTGGTGFWDKVVSGATNSLTKNPLGIASAAFGLGKTMLAGSPNAAEMDALRGQAGALGSQAAALNAQGQQLAAYLQSGTLPPGLQTAVDQATKAYKARVIANHAKNGMSTDPRQNSALAAELGQADTNAIMMAAQLGQQLLQSGQEFMKMGMNAQGLSSKIYEGLIKLDREQSAATGKAIANFAAALSGGFKMAA